MFKSGMNIPLHCFTWDSFLQWSRPSLEWCIIGMHPTAVAFDEHVDCHDEVITYLRDLPCRPDCVATRHGTPAQRHSRVESCHSPLTPPLEPGVEPLLTARLHANWLWTILSTLIHFSIHERVRHKIVNINYSQIPKSKKIDYGLFRAWLFIILWVSMNNFGQYSSSGNCA